LHSCPIKYYTKILSKLDSSDYSAVGPRYRCLPKNNVTGPRNRCSEYTNQRNRGQRRMHCTNPVKTFPIKIKINTKLFIYKRVALYTANKRISDGNQSKWLAVVLADWGPSIPCAKVPSWYQRVCRNERPGVFKWV